MVGQSHWIIAFDSNMEPMQFGFGEWFCDAKAQEEFSTYHVKGVGDKEIGEVLDYFNVSESLDKN